MVTHADVARPLDVMVFVPVYRLEPETVAAVTALAWDGPLTVVLQRDNPARPEDTGMSERETGVGTREIGVGTREIGVRNHFHQYTRGRELFLQSRCEALLVIESDIVPPADALQRLAALDCDVAYGCYLFRQGEIVNVLERYPAPARNVGESLSVWPRKWDAALAAGTVPCSGAGLGCVLIRRHVLEAVAFRLAGTAVHCDTWFTNDVYAAGYEMRADTRVLCGHKDEDGRMLWPKGVICE